MKNYNKTIKNYSSRVIPAVVQNRPMYDISLSTDIVVFGSHLIGIEPTKQIITIQNNGISSVVLVGLSYEAPFNAKFIQSPIIWPDSSMDVEVSFKPEEEGSFESKLILLFNKPIGEREIILTGSGDRGSLLLDGSWETDGSQTLDGVKD